MESHADGSQCGFVSRETLEYGGWIRGPSGFSYPEGLTQLKIASYPSREKRYSVLWLINACMLVFENRPLGTDA